MHKQEVIKQEGIHSLSIHCTSFTLSWPIYKNLNNFGQERDMATGLHDRNEIWPRDLYHSTALVEATKSLVLSNVKGHGKVPYKEMY